MEISKNYISMWAEYNNDYVLTDFKNPPIKETIEHKILEN